MCLLPHIYVSDNLVAAVFEADNVSIDEFCSGANLTAMLAKRGHEVGPLVTTKTMREMSP